MATLCAALQRQHLPVYVVSSAADASAHAVLTNSLGVDVNAVNLAMYLSRVVGEPALLVGHSMGGLFSRVAISRYHASAAGLLFTIGTPFDGSFGADIAEGPANFPCPNSRCIRRHIARQRYGYRTPSRAFCRWTAQETRQVMRRPA